ncbi:MAG: SIMPL domain-containing protein [Blastocatellia bacterium]|nr:SIMPL domain-containing protein [Blastocatellia bacterium]
MRTTTMNEERNYWLNGGVALALGLVLSSLIFGWFYSTAKKGDEAITVTGSAKRRITSDLVLWSAGVSSQAAQLTDAYKQLSDNIPRIKQYLLSKGIPEQQMTVSSISTTTLKGRDREGNETSEVTGYSLQQQIEVRSNDVQKIAQVAREATELINQGILIESNSPQYYYTQIGDLKIEMLGEAAKDAKIRAERIASSTGNSIGSVRSAKMGVLQITAADSTEVSDSGVYNTSTIEKDMTAVVNIGFAVD